jgi:hypothetical protein
MATIKTEPGMNPELGNSGRTRSGQVGEALSHLEKILVDGLRHGFFDYSVACEIVPGGKRQLVIRAGMSHKFTIPEAELPR